MSIAPLSAEGVALRLWESEDASWYVESRDAEVYRWTTENPDLTVDQARTAIQDHRARPTHAGFAIADQETGGLLGNIALVVGASGTGEMSFWLAPPNRGRGAATAAVRLLTQWSFETFPQLLRIELHILAGNVRSQSVAERAGFEGARVVRKEINGKLRDAFVYSKERQ